MVCKLSSHSSSTCTNDNAFLKYTQLVVDFGVEKKISLENLSEQQVAATIKKLSEPPTKSA
jgi:hypothetical protein